MKGIKYTHNLLILTKFRHLMTVLPDHQSFSLGKKMFKFFLFFSFPFFPAAYRPPEKGINKLSIIIDCREFNNTVKIFPLAISPARRLSL